MTLRDVIKSDAITIFENTSEFAEAVTYYFRDGSTRSINAVIDREPPSFYGAGGEVVTPKAMIEIANDDSSQGAAWGAAAGAIRGRRKGAQANAQAQQQAAAQAEQREQVTEEQLTNFKKAFSVCLEAKEYMVKY